MQEWPFGFFLALCTLQVGCFSMASAGTEGDIQSIQKPGLDNPATKCLVFQDAWQGFQDGSKPGCCDFLEAASGFEPEDGGFADLCLTTWLCRLVRALCAWGEYRTQKMEMWSGRRDLNPRLQPWQGCTLPLSYSRASGKALYVMLPFFVKHSFTGTSAFSFWVRTADTGTQKRDVFQTVHS